MQYCNYCKFKDFIYATSDIKKLKEDGGDTDLKKYWINMGRSDDEIAEMKSRIEEELSEVLTHNERKNFDLDKALNRINKAMGD